jgi:hypothetical protein
MTLAGSFGNKTVSTMNKPLKHDGGRYVLGQQAHAGATKDQGDCSFHGFSRKARLNRLVTVSRRLSSDQPHDGISRVTFFQGLQLAREICASALYLRRGRVAGQIMRISEKRRLSDLRLWPVDIGLAWEWPSTITFAEDVGRDGRSYVRRHRPNVADPYMRCCPDVAQRALAFRTHRYRHVWPALRWALVVSLRAAPKDRITGESMMHWEKGQSGGWLLVAVADTLPLCVFYRFW